MLKWWATNKRLFPWRQTKNPYNILVAEVLLHRTKAEQVTPVYTKFIESYPSIGKLAESNIKDIKKTICSLGLNWRIDLIQKMAMTLKNDFHEVIPSNKEELMALPGVGQYIASAVMCFAFNENEPILDTNTVRIISRFLGIPATDCSRRSKYFESAYKNLISGKEPRYFGFAMIDLGALVCYPKDPSCNTCPVKFQCNYSKRGITA